MMATIFLCAVVVQAGFLLVLPSAAKGNDSSDYVEYYAPVAENILNGKGMIDPSGKLGTLYPPGYPVFLAGAYDLADSLGMERIRLIVSLNLLLMSLGCLLVFWTAETIFNTRIALLSAGLWITYLFNLWLIKQPNSEVPFIPLFYGAVYCIVRAIQGQGVGLVVAAGLLLGAAALVRPIVLLLAFVLAAAMVLNRMLSLQKRLSYAVILIAVFCLAVLPWEREVYLQTGQIVPLSTNGPSSILDGLTFTRTSRTDQDRPWMPPSVAQWMQRTWENRQQLRTTGEIFRYLASELKENPKAVLELTGMKLARSWFGTDTRSHERVTQLIQLLYLGLGASGLFLAGGRFREQRCYIVLFIGLVLYFWGMTVVALSILRYLVPVMAYLLIPGAVAVDALIAHWQRSRMGGAAGGWAGA